ncbi:MAG TPA: GTP-binding protein, partial [Bacillota bacterium]|nr:GTP-binding protein [Bacillota bacterium]
AHVRLFSGSLQNRDEIVLPREQETRKIFQIRQFNGAKQEDSGILKAGEIGAIYGLSRIQVGDALGSIALPIKSRTYTHPFLSVQIQTEQAAQDPLLMQALQELSAEDPLLQAEWRKESRAAQVKITGTIQLEIIQSLLQTRFHLQVKLSPPEVLYYETPIHTGIGFEEYTMPKPCWAVVKLQIEPGERGSGYQFSSIVSNDKLYYRYQRHIEQSLQTSLKQGCYGWPVTDLKVTLIDGEHHIVHTHALDFFVATPMAFLKGLQNCGSSLLEPILSYRFEGPSNYANKIVGDIMKMRGRFRGPYIFDGQFRLEAEIPAATSMNYQLTLSRLTDGRCRMTSCFYAYEPCSLVDGKITDRIGISPLDREKWILQARNAL